MHMPFIYVAHPIDFNGIIYMLETRCMHMHLQNRGLSY